MKNLFILFFVISPSLPTLANTEEWNKDNVIELCGGMSSVSPFIGDRGEIFSIKVKNKPNNTAQVNNAGRTALITGGIFET